MTPETVQLQQIHLILLKIAEIISEIGVAIWVMSFLIGFYLLFRIVKG
jgi:hypothetical protein